MTCCSANERVFCMKVEHTARRAIADKGNTTAAPSLMGLVWQARGSPQEAAKEGQSPEEVQGTHRAAGVRAGSRPASFTGSALPPMAHSVGQLPHRAAAGGTPSTTAACAQARPSPDPQVNRLPHILDFQVHSWPGLHKQLVSGSISVDRMSNAQLCRSDISVGTLAF